MRAFKLAVWAGSVIATSTLVSVLAAVPEYSATIIKTYPHDPKAFTEGLLYQNGFLYESTGQEGQSSVRQVQLETGKVLQQHRIGPQYFGEGIVIADNHLIELTWKNQIGFIYDVHTFKPLADFHYAGEGWALTRDRTHVFMSDGTSDIRVLDPSTLHETGRIHVTCDGHLIKNINELEWVNGEIYANIWLTTLIARINPNTGEIVGLANLSNLAALAAAKGRSVDVLNGIAYDAASNRLFVTGKLWPTLYQIRLSPLTNGKDLCDVVAR